MDIKQKNTGLDWNALDEHWSDAYEADYGHFYSNISFERMDVRLQMSAPQRAGIPIGSCF